MIRKVLAKPGRQVRQLACWQGKPFPDGLGKRAKCAAGGSRPLKERSARGMRLL